MWLGDRLPLLSSVAPKRRRSPVKRETQTRAGGVLSTPSLYVKRKHEMCCPPNLRSHRTRTVHRSQSGRGKPPRSRQSRTTRLTPPLPSCTRRPCSPYSPSYVSPPPSSSSCRHPPALYEGSGFGCTVFVCCTMSWRGVTTSSCWMSTAVGAVLTRWRLGWGETTCSPEQVVAPISHPYERGGNARRLFFVAWDRPRPSKPPTNTLVRWWCWRQLVIC